MPNMRLLFLAGAFCALAIAPALSAALSLHVNTGLWEITSATSIQGAPPIPQEALAQLPPERRAKVMAAMRASMANAQKPRTAKNCVTQKDLQRPFRPMTDDPDTKCTESVVTASSTTEDIRISCTGRHAMDGHFTFEAPSPGTMHGKIAMDIQEGGKTMHMNSDVTGRWLSPSCGSVKPHEG